MEETIPSLFRRTVERYPDGIAQYAKTGDGSFVPVTWAELSGEVSRFAAGLLAAGVKPGDRVGLVADNRREWLTADLALLSIGAADVPRGTDSPVRELRYILEFSGCETVIVENAGQLRKVLSLLDGLPRLGRIVVLDPEYRDHSNGDERRRDRPAPQGERDAGERNERGRPEPVEVYPYGRIVEDGRRMLGRDPSCVERPAVSVRSSDLATVIFTSGTTGTPKGVMLTHGNLVSQIDGVPARFEIRPDDIWLSVLPVWHSFERIMQYVALGTASAIAYSKPIGKIMLADFKALRPTWMASVPRIWESVMSGVYAAAKAGGPLKLAVFRACTALCWAHAYFTMMSRGLLPRYRGPADPRFARAAGAAMRTLLSPFRAAGDALVFRKIRETLGGRFVAGISGGGALPSNVDRFFAAAGVTILEGYGLTETSPVLAVRDHHGPVFATVGPPFPGTEIRIVDENRADLPPGRQGRILARGPQVMAGYLGREEETRAAIDSDGWFDTGDLGMLTVNGALKVTGRAKDTIVLVSGTNVEPAPIEQKLRESPFIEHAVLFGQDRRHLAALIVPRAAALDRFARETGLAYTDLKDLVRKPEVRSLIGAEIRSLVSARTGFRNCERIARFALLDAPFEHGAELSAKGDPVRHVIHEKYRKSVEELFR